MKAPLADRIRPDSLNLVVGQHHLLDEGKILRKIIESGEIPNMIFYGPSGVGKTTVANIIAKKSGKSLYRLNATTAKTADLKEIIASRKDFSNQNGILLYLDEIQYFNKKQQQTLLEYIENGDITLIASTTENPYFYVYGAVLSRSFVFEFKPLSRADIKTFVSYAFDFLSEENGCGIKADDDAKEVIADSSGGDLRRAINVAELCFITGERINSNGKEYVRISKEAAMALAKSGATKYDRDTDEHYDLISAYQKSMRGSDPDAALYYLAKILAAGDLPSACRRLLVTASEDVGLANPAVLPFVKACVDSALMLGLPEAKIPLADAVVFVSISPKSNSAYIGIHKATADAESGSSATVPRHLQNKHFDGDDAAVKGQFYKYPHDYKNHYVKQQYLPDEFKNSVYYTFGDNKTEQGYKGYMEKIKGNKPNNK